MRSRAVDRLDRSEFADRLIRSSLASLTVCVRAHAKTCTRVSVCFNHQRGSVDSLVMHE